MNTPLICKKAVRETALALAAQKYTVAAYRPGRVAGSFLERINAQVHNLIKAEIERRPAKGKTIQ